MSGQILWGKFAIWTTAIMAGGWGIMRWAIPTDEQFYDKLSPELKRKYDDVMAQKAGKDDMRKKLENAGESDQIVWADQFASAKSNSGNKKV